MASQKIFDVPQDTSGKYTAQFLDEDGVGLSSASVDNLTLTLYDTETEDIINSREDQNVLNTNQVTLDTLGNLVWSWVPDDMPVLHITSRTPEVHTALFICTWNSGANQLLHEVSFRVTKIRSLSIAKTVSSLTSVTTTATATSAGHLFTTGDSVTIAGATPTAYNGTYTITVTGANTFTYAFAGGTSPATGTITVTKEIP